MRPKNKLQTPAPAGKKPKARFSPAKASYYVFLGFMMFLMATQPVYASDVWTKATEIMKDVYNQIVLISTVAAIVTASVALLMMNFSRSGRTVDESRAWLKRICITWAILNGLGAGIEAENPVRLSIRSVLFILLAYFSDGIVDTVLKIGGTPYHWIMDSDLPALSFADFNSVMLAIIDVCANGAVALITLIIVLILAWNYLKLLLEAAERYILLEVLVYTAPVAFSITVVLGALLLAALNPDLQ